jgi:hypothetical protein
VKKDVSGKISLVFLQVSAQTEEVVEEEQLAEPMMVYKEEGMVFVCCTKNDVWT